MQFIETKIPGCYKVIPEVFSDTRGDFVKMFQQDLFLEKGLETRFVESFYSISRRKVLRGMHFQLPPYDYTKIVYCISGEVLDVVVDLRVGSPVYGIPFQFRLIGKESKALYIPKGIAHGFYTISESATMVYQTSRLHNKEYDSGILWSSFSIWPDLKPIVSQKDAGFMRIDDFKSPFVF